MKEKEDILKPREDEGEANGTNWANRAYGAYGEDLSEGRIIAEVCCEYGVREEDVKSRCRKMEIAEARQMIAYLLRIHCRLPLTEIGDILGRKHPTVDYSIHNIENLLETNKATKRHYLNIIKRLNNESA